MQVARRHRGRSARASFLVSLAALALAVAGCAHASSTASGPSSPLASTAVASSPASAFPVTLSDDDGVAVTMAREPARIVTFAPSDTEILFALGEGAKVVGVSGSFDDYPAAAQAIAHVGGENGVEPNLEKVVALHPDLLVTFGGKQDWKTRIREAGIPVFSIDSTSLDDLFHDIDTVGRLTGAVAQAQTLVASMRARDATVEHTVAAEAPVSCFFEVYYPPLSTVGPGSFIFDLLRRAGCDPVTKDATSAYPEWSVDQLVKDDPQVYLVGSAPGVSAAAIARRPGFSAIAAVKGGRIEIVDSDLVTRNGPRMIDGLEALAKALHPDLFGA
jgi:iron complex transport system substrate-binding protein